MICASYVQLKCLAGRGLERNFTRGYKNW